MHSRSPVCAVAVFMLIAVAWISGCASIKATASPPDRAAEVGDLEETGALIGQHPELVFRRDHDGATLLDIAASHGHRDVVELLLANHAEVNTRDNDGWTPLHRAAWNGHGDVVELLLANHAEVNTRNNDGWTPLDAARIRGQSDAAEALLAHHAEANRTAAKVSSRPQVVGIVTLTCDRIEVPLDAYSRDAVIVPSGTYIVNTGTQTVNGVRATITADTVRWHEENWPAACDF